jgi:hypothetical protein
MNVLKYLGIFILLIGVGVLTVPTILGIASNTYLLVGLLLIAIGYFGYIILNKRVE